MTKLSEVNPNFVSAYGPKNPVAFVPIDDGRTVQSEAAACDINYIVARYQTTGVIDHVKKYQGQYGEFPSMEYREALDMVRRSEALFATVPSSIRTRFDNDPASFLSFVENPANIDELRTMGLANPLTPTAPLPSVTPPPVAVVVPTT